MHDCVSIYYTEILVTDFEFFCIFQRLPIQKILSQHDYSRWIEALQNLPVVPSDLMAWVENDLHRFFPFEKAFFAYGELIAGQIKTTHWLSVGYSHDYLQSQAADLEIETRGSLQWWFANRQPFYIDPELPPAFASAHELSEIKTLGLKNIAAHGILNLRASAGTYFSFAGVPAPLSEWHLQALRIITPVLNDQYLAHMASQTESVTSGLAVLSARQKAIVRQFAATSNDKTLAKNLGISEKTVRNQLTEIYARLGIKKRTQLLRILR